MFSKDTYIARRAKLKQTIGSGLLLFLGNDECGMNYADNTYHFRQDSTNFFTAHNNIIWPFDLCVQDAAGAGFCVGVIVQSLT